jgi:hypothetical protein
MVSYIIPTLRSKPFGEQARLLGSIRNYIKDDNLTNLLQNYDYNSKANDKMLSAQLNSFANIPGLDQQVRQWLSS